MIRDHIPQPAAKSARKTRELSRRIGKLSEAQAAMSWGVILLIVMVLGAIYLNQSSKTAAVGRSAQRLDYKLGEIERVNADIERDIAEAQGLQRLDQEATRLGFVPAQSSDIEYEVIGNYPAALLASPAAAPQEPQRAKPPETMQEALRIVLQDRLDDFMRGESGER
jgi:cell division protein FtsL